MRIQRFIKQFNWRFLVVRILVNAIALAITAAVTPKIYFVDRSIVSWLLITVMLGVLNALLKPLLQFLTLRFIFVTYGLVIVLVNTLILLFLSFLFPTRFAVDNLLWALVGGLVLGLLSSFLESLLGLTMPIVPEEEVALRRQPAEEARPISWRVTGRRETISGEQAPAIEPPPAEAEAKAPVMAEPAVKEATVTGPSTAEPPVASAAQPADAAVPAEREPAPEAREEQEEDRA
jgi:putative membrane protein